MRGDIADQAPRRSVIDVRGAGNRLDTPCRRLHVQCRVAKKGAWRSFFVWGTRSQRPGPYPSPHQTQLPNRRSEEHTSELQSLMRISYAVFCLPKKTTHYSSDYNHKN